MRVEWKAAAALALVIGCLFLWLGAGGEFAACVSEILVRETEDETTDVQMVTLERNGERMEIELEEYLKGVVGSEMTPSYEMEALKAQAVAARTFVASRNYRVDDSTSSQVYLDDSQLRTAWKEDYEESQQRVAAAVDATRGEIMVVDGEPITAFFFASSGGKTANSEDYYSGELSYLRSVESPWDAEVDSDYVTQFQCSREELGNALGLNAPISVIEDPVRYDSGYVQSVTIDGVSFSGREIRETLQLKSSCFTIAVDGDTITFTVKGFGHGVGMSQEGAQGMALEGYGYEEILKHYYTGIQFADVYNS